MAIGMLQELPNATAETYEAVSEKLGARENPPDGLVFHTAGPAEGGGFRIFEVWESREAQERFFQERVLPAVKEVVGDAAEAHPPKQEIYELHAVLTP